jgi:hypothetical protein
LCLPVFTINYVLYLRVELETGCSDGSSRRHEDESEDTQNNNVTAVVVDTGHEPCMDDLELNFARITTSS